MTGALWRRVLDRLARQLRAEERPTPRQDGRAGFTCPRCCRTSYHPMDLRYGWCSNCNDYTAPPSSGRADHE